MNDEKKPGDLLVDFLNGTLKPADEMRLVEFIGQVAASYGKLHDCSASAGKARLFKALHDLRYAFEKIELGYYG